MQTAGFIQLLSPQLKCLPLALLVCNFGLTRYMGSGEKVLSIILLVSGELLPLNGALNLARGV